MNDQREPTDLRICGASEGFEVSHAPERYLALDDKQVEKLYADPAFDYLRRFVASEIEKWAALIKAANIGTQ